MSPSKAVDLKHLRTATAVADFREALIMFERRTPWLVGIGSTVVAGGLGYLTESTARRKGARFPSHGHTVADLFWKGGTLAVMIYGFQRAEGRRPTLDDLGWRGSDISVEQRSRRGRIAVPGVMALSVAGPLVSRFVGRSVADPASFGSRPQRVEISVALGELLVRYPLTVFVEESFFRGWLYPRAGGPRPLTTGALFALYHLQQAGTIPSLVPAGTALGVLRWWRGNLWGAAALHYVANAAFFVSNYLLDDPLASS